MEGAVQVYRSMSGPWERPAVRAESGCAVGGVSEANHGICLRAFLALDDVEFDFIAFLERLVPIQLDRGVVYKYIRPVFASDKSVALGVVEPLDLTFELSHRLLPSWCFLRGIRREQ